MEKKYFDIAYKEAIKGFKIGEIPVGCVIVYRNKIIAKAHNLKEKYNDPTYHAEILAIRKATKKINNWRLNDCVLYTTVKPCLMCMGAIMESRISKIYYLVETEDDKHYYNDLSVEKCDYLYNDSLKLLKSFFESKR